MGGPSGTVTFLFTDIEGSTALWDKAPDAMRNALALHDAVVLAAIEQHGGYVFATGGDGFAAAFAKAGDALAAGVKAQQGLRLCAWRDDASVRVRIGIHTGEAWERDDDYFGTAVNIAARLMGIAGAGQVLCSQATALLVAGQPEWEILELGEHELRGLSTPVRVFGVVAEGVDPPTIKSARTIGNLPHVPTEFVGRSEEVRQLVSLLRPRRCVTLTGTGGVGKTRLGIEVAWTVASELADGAWLIDLASVIDPALVTLAIAQAMEVRLGEGLPPLDAFIEAMRARQALVLLDNCEHLLDSCSEVATRLIAECGDVALLATSREPLGIAGEQVWRVASLDAGGDAVELFLDRALAADSSFSPSREGIGEIEQICTRLDGIPLAIELAAAQLRTLGTAGLLARLDDRLALLRGGRRGGVERHQTLRAAVAWSYQLLTNEQAVVFDRCSVFADSFDLDAAVAVCGEGVDELDVIELLSGLVDKSMLTALPDERGPRYRMLETLRQFGEEQLNAGGGLFAVAARHLAYFMAVAESAGDTYETREQLDGAAVFVADWGNLRVALGWAVGQRDAAAAKRIVAASAMFAINRLRYEHEEWAQSVLRISTEDDDALLRGVSAYWKVCRGDYEEAVARAAGTPTYWSLMAAHQALYAMGDLDGAAAEAEDLAALTKDDRPYRRLTAAVMVAQAAFGKNEGLAEACVDVFGLAREVDSPSARSFAYGWRAMSTAMSGDPAVALDLISRAIDQAHEAGLLMLEGGWMTGAAFLFAGLATEDSASTASFARVLQHCAATGDGFNTWTALESFGIYLANIGRVEPAAMLFGCLDHNNRHTADMAGLRAPADAAVAGAPHASVLMQHGATMTRAEALDYALATIDGDVRPETI